jgi:hypothetical protein
MGATQSKPSGPPRRNAPKNGIVWGGKVEERGLGGGAWRGEGGIGGWREVPACTPEKENGSPGAPQGARHPQAVRGAGWGKGVARGGERAEEAGGARCGAMQKVRRARSCSTMSEFETKHDESEPFTVNVKMPGPSESTCQRGAESVSPGPSFSQRSPHRAQLPTRAAGGWCASSCRTSTPSSRPPSASATPSVTPMSTGPCASRRSGKRGGREDGVGWGVGGVQGEWHRLSRCTERLKAA